MHLDREWADAVIAEIGDAPYVELASVVVTTVAADAFCEAMGIDPEPLPAPEAGEPTRERPDNLGEIGAWVPVQVIDWKRANVARALSLAPEGVRTFFRMVAAMYSGTPLSRTARAGRRRWLAPDGWRGCVGGGDLEAGGGSGDGDRADPGSGGSATPGG